MNARLAMLPTEKAPSPRPRGRGGTLVTPPRRGLGAFDCALGDASETGLEAFDCAGRGGTLVTPPRRGLGAFDYVLCDASEMGVGAFECALGDAPETGGGGLLIVQGGGGTLVTPPAEKAPSPRARERVCVVTPSGRGLGAVECAVCDAPETGAGSLYMCALRRPLLKRLRALVPEGRVVRW